MNITANLPDKIKRFSYQKNSHYIELEDNDGNIYKGIAKYLLRSSCKSCPYEFFSETNLGQNTCPSCGEEMIKTWGKLQLCFLPEKESNFKL